MMRNTHFVDDEVDLLMELDDVELEPFDDLEPLGPTGSAAGKPSALQSLRNLLGFEILSTGRRSGAPRPTLAAGRRRGVPRPEAAPQPSASLPPEEFSAWG